MTKFDSEVLIIFSYATVTLHLTWSSVEIGNDKRTTQTSVCTADSAQPIKLATHRHFYKRDGRYGWSSLRKPLLPTQTRPVEACL